MLLIMLEVHFSLLFANKAHLRCVLWCIKSGRHCFSCRSLLLGTSAPNDIYVRVKSLPPVLYGNKARGRDG